MGLVNKTYWVVIMCVVLVIAATFYFVFNNNNIELSDSTSKFDGQKIYSSAQTTDQVFIANKNRNDREALQVKNKAVKSTITNKNGQISKQPTKVDSTAKRVIADKDNNTKQTSTITVASTDNSSTESTDAFINTDDEEKDIESIIEPESEPDTTVSSLHDDENLSENEQLDMIEEIELSDEDKIITTNDSQPLSLGDNLSEDTGDGVVVSQN